VLDSAGRLIGMIIGTLDGKAVLSPAWLMDPVADELDELGRVNQGWMGINGETIESTTEPTKDQGVHVLAVTPQSAAAKAGIVAGDVITSIGSDRVRSIAGLQGHLYIARPGDVVVVGLRHDQHATSVRVTLAGAHV
jgi:S1-C subfamily serine protease